MKHLIIGSGIVGEATGVLLSAHEEKVIYHDKSKSILDAFKKHKREVLYNIKDTDLGSFNLIWVCTAEWNVKDVFKVLKKHNKSNLRVIIRATMPPGDTKKIENIYKEYTIAHIPEFLRAKNHLEDVFDPDRIIIGVNNHDFGYLLESFFSNMHPNKPVVIVSTTTSELIKLASNGWLSTIISYWNEIYKICKLYKVNPQEVANGCILDHRISSYGSKMIGESFSGFCLPKDLVSLHNALRNKKTTSEFLKVVSKINEETDK